MSPERHKKIPIIRIKNIPVPKEQIGFSVVNDKTEDLDFAPPHSKGSREIRPPQKREPRTKRKTIEQLDPGVQFAILIKEEFDPGKARVMVARQDFTDYHPPRLKRTIDQTSEGGLVVSDQGRHGHVDSLIGPQEGMHTRLRNLPPDTMGTAKID